MFITIMAPVSIENSVHESVVKADSKDDVIKLIHVYSERYGVPYQTMYRKIDCESNHTFNPKIKSQVVYNFSDPKRGISKGQLEKSIGLAQIHLPDHPEISLEQAENAEFSIEFMARNLSRGKDIWSCK